MPSSLPCQPGWIRSYELPATITFIGRGWLVVYEFVSMLSTKDIIREIWDAQGYGNLAVWDDGTTQVVGPGQMPLKDGLPPRAVFKPLPLVGGFPMLDHALYDRRLQDTIEETIRSSGGEITRD